MYIPAWPSLNPALFLRRPARQELPFPLDRPDNAYFYVARNGIYQLFRHLQADPDAEVLAPDYHHGNEIYALQAAGVKVRYYPVRPNMDVDMDGLARLCDGRTRILYLTHFIGWPQPMDDIMQFCRDRNLRLVEDCALAMLSRWGEAPLGSFGDYAIFCLYKTLPLPNGGALVKNRGEGPDPAALRLRAPGRLSVGARSSELLLQWLRARHEKTGAALFDLKRRAGRTLSAGGVQRTPVGDTGFDTSVADQGISPMCHYLMRRIDYDEVLRRRRENFKILRDGLEGAASPVRGDLAEGVCPLFFPLLVSDKQAAARRLWAAGIETVEFWNEGDPAAPPSGGAAAWLRRHVLEVPLHQEIDAPRLEHMVRHIRALGPELLRPEAAP